MPSFLKSVAVPALALAGGSLANPFKRGDACLAAVTGKAALGDESLRKEHCSSFIKTIVTPPAITVTTTVTDPEPTEWENYKRAVTVCPNEVPNYASACDEAGYKSACSVFGIAGETTFTIPATTTTKTVYLGGSSTCDGAAETTTVTVDKGSATVTSTVTVGKGGSTATDSGATTTVTEGTVTKTITVGKDGSTVTGSGETTTVTEGTVTKTVTVGKDGSTVTDSGATTTVTEGTVTKTVTVGKDGSTVTDSGATTTVTSTVTVSKDGSTVTGSVSTVTVTAAANATTTTVTVSDSAPSTGPTGKCISKEKADYFVNGFIELLEYTSYPGSTNPPTPAGRGYHQNVSDAILDPKFVDYSDSINWMAGIPLGGPTFPNKAAFDAGQGMGQPEVAVETLNTWYGCNTITWRWHLTPFTQASVIGINQFIISDDGEKIIANYAEFDNAAWLASFGLQCKVPTAPSTNSTSTTSATTTTTV